MKRAAHYINYWENGGLRKKKKIVCFFVIRKQGGLVRLKKKVFPSSSHYNEGKKERG